MLNVPSFYRVVYCFVYRVIVLYLGIFQLSSVFWCAQLRVNVAAQKSHAIQIIAGLWNAYAHKPQICHRNQLKCGCACPAPTHVLTYVLTHVPTYVLTLRLCFGCPK